MLINALILFAIFLITFGLSLLFITKLTSNDRKIKGRLGGFNISPSLEIDEDNKFVKMFNSLLERLMDFSSPQKQIEKEEFKKKFISAGINNQQWMIRFFGFKTFFTFIVPVLYILFATFFAKDASATDMFMVAVTLAIAGYYLPNAVLASKVKSRKAEIFSAFPDALDLIRVCVAAGMGLDAATARVGNEMSVSSKAISDEFRQLNLELRAGLSRANALQNFAIRCDLEEIKAFVAMLIQAEKFGTSISEALVIFSEDLRSKRKLKAQEVAAQIPVKLSLPILLCIFPAIFIILLAPPIANVITMFK